MTEKTKKILNWTMIIFMIIVIILGVILPLIV